VGNVIGERMDNLIHASATESDAEREIKIWFKPSDIPPFMRAYPTETSAEHYYFQDGKLYRSHEPDSVCLLAPGDVVWKSDLEALRLQYEGLPAPCSLAAVAAKYLINEE
jgi:nucleoside-diphosphate kinase